ncbi:hypothetical protein G6L37_06690 [Agrobacterium rubi]|nr:hypothetical protein [Agrobacterium rubi]NTF25051.1 hypothetical protein [Agrobacterium rubi]
MEPAGNIDLVYISGSIEAGDSRKFASRVPGNRHAIVFLDSPGGAVQEGLNIGLQVRHHGFATAVPNSGTCASICSMIWLAGSTRYFENQSKVGFHAAYHLRAGEVSVSSSANAEIGYYIGAIGLAPHVARIATEPSPDSMLWMGAVDLLYSGIAVMSASAMGDPGDVKPRPWSVSPREVDGGSFSPDIARTALIGRKALSAFSSVYVEAGITEAQRKSRSCWGEVKGDGSPDLIRYCLIFDMLGMDADLKATHGRGLPPTEYFGANQISTRLIAFMKKHGYVPRQIDEFLSSASLWRWSL